MDTTTQPYVLHYTSADGPGPDPTCPWSVYVEQYVTPDAPEPIDGSQRKVSTHPNFAEAEAEASRLQALANQPVRLACADCNGAYSTDPDSDAWDLCPSTNVRCRPVPAPLTESPTTDLPNGTVIDLGRGVYICAEHDRRVYVAQGDGPAYSAGDLVHFAGDGSVCLAASEVEPVEKAFLFRIPLWVHVKDGKIVRAVVDDEYPKRDEAPIAIVRDAGDGWAASDHRSLTKDEVAEWFSVRQGEWPAWDFSW